MAKSVVTDFCYEATFVTFPSSLSAAHVSNSRTKGQIRMFLHLYAAQKYFQWIRTSLPLCDRSDLHSFHFAANTLHLGNLEVEKASFKFFSNFCFVQGKKKERTLKWNWSNSLWYRVSQEKLSGVWPELNRVCWNTYCINIMFSYFKLNSCILYVCIF